MPAEKPQVRQYWDLVFEPDHSIGEAEAMAELEERLREAVEIRMIAEVPLGVKLLTKSGFEAHGKAIVLPVLCFPAVLMGLAARLALARWQRTAAARGA